MRSVDQVLPEFQHPKVGETIGFGANRMRLERVDPERVLAWRSEDGNWLWTFVLRGQGGTTRLISRNRFRLPTLAARIGMVPMEPASLVMERKMLLGIKRRAEGLATASNNKRDGSDEAVAQSTQRRRPGSDSPVRIDSSVADRSRPRKVRRCRQHSNSHQTH